MRPGTKPAKRVRLTDDTRRAIDASGATHSQLAEIGGWPHLEQLSTLLHAEDFPGTRITIERVARLGAALGLAASQVFEVAR